MVAVKILGLILLLLVMAIVSAVGLAIITYAIYWMVDIIADSIIDMFRR